MLNKTALVAVLWLLLAAPTALASESSSELFISDTTPEPGDESGVVIQSPDFASGSEVEVFINDMFVTATVATGGIFATELFPTEDQCGRTMEIEARGQSPSGEELVVSGSYTVTCQGQADSEGAPRKELAFTGVITGGAAGLMGLGLLSLCVGILLRSRSKTTSTPPGRRP